MPDDERVQLYGEISKLIDTEYDGRIVKQYNAVLDLRKKRNV